MEHTPHVVTLLEAHNIVLFGTPSSSNEPTSTPIAAMVAVEQIPPKKIVRQYLDECVARGRASLEIPLRRRNINLAPKAQTLLVRCGWVADDTVASTPCLGRFVSPTSAILFGRHILRVHAALHQMCMLVAFPLRSRQIKVMVPSCTVSAPARVHVKIPPAPTQSATF